MMINERSTATAACPVDFHLIANFQSIPTFLHISIKINSPEKPNNLHRSGGGVGVVDKARTTKKEKGRLSLGNNKHSLLFASLLDEFPAADAAERLFSHVISRSGAGDTGRPAGTVPVQTQIGEGDKNCHVGQHLQAFPFNSPSVRPRVPPPRPSLRVEAQSSPLPAF